MVKIVYTILIFGLYICMHIYFNTQVQKNGHNFYMNRVDKQKTTPKVYDVMHKLLPKDVEKEWIINYIILLSLVPLLLDFNTELLYNFVGLFLTINLIRDITVNLTILPKNTECIPDKTLVSHILGSCYDKIFSSHFAFVYLLTLLYYSYGYISNIPVLIGMNVINALFILITRAHYTIDIVMSFFVCSFIFVQNYNIFNMFI
jgi:hypothetical protein